MRELVGRLAGLDPGATETLRVIQYFDTLVDGHVGLEAFLRGAALLTGAPAGLVVPDRRLVLRVDADGHRGGVSSARPDDWPSRPVGGAGAVWIEREGPAHANDPMVLERLAQGVRITLDRTAIPHADIGAGIEQLIDLTLPAEERLRAADRLHLDRPVRVVAAPPDDVVASRARRATIVTTVAGPVFAVLDPGTGPAPDPDSGPDPARFPARAGVGGPVAPAGVAGAWTDALVALRLTTRRRPIIDVAELGVLTVLAAGVDTLTGVPPDAAVIARLASAEPAVLDTLDEIAGQESLRAAATALGVHHSTVQHRILALRAALGFDPTGPGGRCRLAMALAVHRLLTTRFGIQGAGDGNEA